MRKFIPIILGSDENAYACARMFYEINGESSLVFCAKALPQTSYSGILNRFVIEDFDKENVFRSVMNDILPKLKLKTEKLLLVPCSDYYAALVTKNSSLISKYASSPILKWELYKRLCDKTEFCGLCAEYGISHPKSEITSPQAILSSEVARNYPLMLKPSNSNSFAYLHTVFDGKKKAYFCESEIELKKTAEMFVKAGYIAPVILQEYIEGGEEYSRVVNAYCDANGKVRIIGAGKPLLEYQNDREIGNYAAVRTLCDRNLCDEAADILEKIGYVGFANLDIKVDKKTGKNIFLEINPRQGRSSYYMRVAGVNLMRALYDDAVLEKAYTERKYAEKEGVWINEPSNVIKREMNMRGLTDFDGVATGKSALGITYDFSVPRACTLIRRRLGAFIKDI